jgi:hypothetical protein
MKIADITMKLLGARSASPVSPCPTVQPLANRRAHAQADSAHETFHESRGIGCIQCDQAGAARREPTACHHAEYQQRVPGRQRVARDEREEAGRPGRDRQAEVMAGCGRQRPCERGGDADPRNRFSTNSRRPPCLATSATSRPAGGGLRRRGNNGPGLQGRRITLTCGPVRAALL